MWFIIILCITNWRWNRFFVWSVVKFIIIFFLFKKTISAKIKKVYLCFRDEYFNRIRPRSWAKDSRGGAESLSQVKWFGQRNPNFGSCEGENWAPKQTLPPIRFVSVIMLLFLRTKPALIRRSIHTWSRSWSLH